MITRFSTSSLNTYATCPKLFDWKYNYNLLDETPATLSRRFGEVMIHKVLTDWYKAEGNYQPDFEKIWVEELAPTDAEMMIKRNAVYNIKLAKAIFEEYRTRFEIDFKDYEVYNVEQYTFRDESVLPYGNKCDVVLRDKATGLLVPCEIKSSLYEFILIAKEINHQFLGELWTYDSLKGIVNFVHMVKDWSIIRFPIEVTPQQMDRWQADTEYRIMQIEHNYKYGHWPMNAPMACARFNQECPFLSLCEADDADMLAEAWPKREIKAQ